jgi:predicted CXXCH cytochrome family protein
LGGLLAADWWVALPSDQQATYVGRQRCAECHAAQMAAFQGSDHDLAMDRATESTVLGDFNDQELTHFGVASRMFREGDEYWVETQGADGQMGRYRVDYVLGVRPLQQYMVEFPDGRIQVLPVAWDTEARRWFHIYPDEAIPPDDVLHWTSWSQNFNQMCADCHTTNYHKGYDFQSDRYASDYSEIDVSCEACHGPGSTHVELATANSLFWDRNLGYGLARLKGTDSKPQLDTCAKCHSRRGLVHEDYLPGHEFLDHYALGLLDDGTYYPDGQILEEDYVYGSFLQSRMYREGVRCTDCHDPHSTRLKFSGNQLCTQCHVKAKYDAPAHHHHEPDGKGASCVECHMPERTYMVVDPRRDHSIRIPRPDLTMKLGTPNACNGCHEHEEQTPQWAAEWVDRWYPASKRPEPHFGEAIAAGRNRDPEAVEGLLKLGKSRSVGPMVRSSAIMLLGPYAEPKVRSALRQWMRDQDPLIRLAAVRAIAHPDAIQHSPTNPARELPIEDLLIRLDDPVQLVRSEAARVLNAAGADEMNPQQRRALRTALAEYEATQHLNSDVPAGRLNLGTLRAIADKPLEAEAYFKAALEQFPEQVEAREMLFGLYLQQGRREDALAMLRELVEAEPDAWYRHYQLGLLLAEDPQQLEQAAVSLGKAVQASVENPRLRYNYGLALQRIGQQDAAEAQLQAAYRLDPDSIDYANALTMFYVEAKRWQEAEHYALAMDRLQPNTPRILQVLRLIRQQKAQQSTQGPAAP